MRKTPEDNPDDTAVYADFRVSANGNSEKGETTTRLTLSFSQTAAGLTAADITLTDNWHTGIQKGALSKANDGTGDYTLAVSGITKELSVGVKVAAPEGVFFLRGNDERWVWVGYGTVQSSRFAA